MESIFVSNLKHYFWIFAPLILLITIAVVGIAWVLLANANSANHRATPADVAGNRPAGQRSILSLLDERSLMNAYIEASATGGREALSTLVLIRSKGHIFWKGERLEYTLTKRHPNLMLLELKRPDSTTTYGFDGNKFWQQLVPVGEAPSILPVSEEDASQLRRLTRFHDPFMAYILEGRGIVQVIEFDDYAGAPAMRIQLREPNSARLDIYLSADSLEVLASVEHLPGSNKRRTSQYEDYRRINGIRVPFLVTVSSDGALIYRLEVNSQQADIGVMSALFLPPKKLL
jgi:hypothetical protein